MKRVWKYVITMWQPALFLLVGCIVVFGLYTTRLSSFPNALTATEKATRTASSSLSVITDNPINAPYKVLHMAASTISDSIVSARMVSVVLTLISLLLFYLLANQLTSKVAAFLGVVLFATSSSLLHTGRFATPQITLVLLLALVCAGYLIKFYTVKNRTWLLAALLIGVSLYTPGLVWFIVLGACWQFRSFKKHKIFPQVPILIASLSIVAITIAPLLYGFIQNPSLWREYALIPKTFPDFTTVLTNLAHIPYGIFVSAESNPLYRVGRQPLLDIFGIGMFILGTYVCMKRLKLQRSVFFAAIFIVGSIVTAISNTYENTFMLVPFIYLLVALGIGYLLEEWARIFPNNPLARWLSFGLIGLAVVVSCNFQARRYFVVWPNNPDTKTVLEKQ